MRKPSNTLLEAMDQMEQIPGIAGVWSEVRCQTRHTKPMRNGEDLNHAIIDTGSAIVTAENIDDPEIQAVINPK